MLTHARSMGKRMTSRQRGLSIVEMMVGVAVGLIIVAAASMTVATQLSDNRKLLMEMQVQQDLRAATDIISRDVRRAGFWADAGANEVPVPGATIDDQSNVLAAVTPASGATSIVEYRYDRIAPSGSPANKFGFCYGAGCTGGSPGAIKSKLTTASGLEQWHQLTDDKAVNITALTVTPVSGPAVRLACPSLCPGTNDTACWPTIAVREVLITVTGQAVTDPSVQRTLTSRVRLRNDLVTLSVPGSSPSKLLACPAL